MSILYIAMSKTLAAWAADVGLGKHVYKVGVAEGAVEEALKALNGDTCAGAGDWLLAGTQNAGPLDEAQVLERLSRKEKMVDPNYYPRLRGAMGIFRVKVANVASHLLVKRALAGEEEKVDKIKPTDIAAYLIQMLNPRGAAAKTADES